MIILDTNIVAELMREAPASGVVDWLNGQPSSTLFLSTITLGEITYGLRILPSSRRRRALEAGFERVIATGFASRILTFDEAAAREYGEIMGRRKEMGRPLGIMDGQIAAIARSKGYAVATRNVRDFLDCGVEILNPFGHGSTR